MSKRYTLFLSLICILFTAFFTMLCAYSRLATDDYYFIWDVRHHGVIEGIRSQYMEWCGRFAATGFMDVIYKTLDVNQTWYFLFPLLSFFALCGGIYFSFSALAFQFRFVLQRSHQLIFSILFTALLFFLSIDVGETWIWYCSLSSYLWSVIAIAWAFAFLFGNYNTFVSVLFSSLCFIYVGGSSEVYSVIYGLIILLYLIYRYKRSDGFYFFMKDDLNRKVLITYFILGISFLVFMLAPGNYLRDELFPRHELINTLFITVKSIVKASVLYLSPRLPYLLAFAVPFVVIGKKIREQHSGFTLTFRSFFFRATAIFLSLSLLFFLIVAYVMVETGPPRIWFILSFLAALYSSSTCFYAGYSGYLNDKKTAILSSSGLLLAFVIISYNGIRQFVTAKKYAAAHDARIEQLLQLRQTIRHDTTIVLPALPSSGMLYSSEIAADTTHFTNKELRLGYELKFHVVSLKK